MISANKEYTLITGACGGLGGAFCRELSLRGESLFLTGRSEERLNALKSELPEDTLCYPCDLSDGESRRRFFEEVDRSKISFRRLVYVAGVDIQKGFERYTEEGIVLQARVNFEGAVSFTRAFLSRLDTKVRGEILYVGSVSGIYPMPYFALYSATKKALEQFSSALRVELRRRVNVTCVLPGAIPTREDIKANISTQGLWGKLAVKSPQAVVKASLKAVSRNKRKVIIGFWNKLMRAFTAMLLLSWKMKFIAKKWSKTEKDAFLQEK